MLHAKMQQKKQKVEATLSISSFVCCNDMPEMRRTIFVTVGTTLFDKLVSATTSPSALQWMASHGYTRLVVQYGKGSEPTLPKNSPLKDGIETYRFRPTLDDDMRQADLIISHAGAGTVMEAMKLGKHLVVVINTALMDNHQTELAHAMGNRNHLFVVNSPEEMEDIRTWDNFEEFIPVPCESGDDTDFPRLVDALMGFSKER